MTIKIVTFGEIMMRLSPPGYQRFGQARAFDLTYGGGERISSTCSREKATCSHRSRAGNTGLQSAGT